MKKKFDKLDKSRPRQLELFEMMVGTVETDVLRSRRSGYADYSRTIELYDFCPKFVWKGQDKIRRRNNGFLPMLERDFECRNVKYKILIQPAGIKDEKSGKEKWYYPGETEEIVEDVLRKLALEKGGTFLDDKVGLTFSVNQIRSELIAIGHQRTYAEIKRALHILRKTSYELTSTENKDKIIFSPIDMLGFRGEDGETQTFVIFSRLVTESVLNLTFRLYNYRRAMNYKSLISRQLHKRLAHHFTQASIANKYTINLTTLIRDFGLTAQSSLGKNLEHVRAALDEMSSKENDVVLKYNCVPVIDSKRNGKLVEVSIEITPTMRFSQEVTKANYLAKEERKRLDEDS